jgi:hypothetical protein
MLINIDRIHHIVTVKKQEGDPVFRTTEWASAESTFLYRIKKKLQDVGYDCIKKRMWKDGHLVDDNQQYIRDRKGEWAIYNDAYAIFDAGERFNQTGVVILRFEDWK